MGEKPSPLTQAEQDRIRTEGTHSDRVVTKVVVGSEKLENRQNVLGGKIKSKVDTKGQRVMVDLDPGKEKKEERKAA